MTQAPGNLEQVTISLPVEAETTTEGSGKVVDKGERHENVESKVLKNNNIPTTITTTTVDSQP